MDPLADLLRDSAAKLFAQHVSPALALAAEAGVWPEAAWAAIAEAGLPLALVAEARGGAGVPIPDALGLLRVAGAHDVALPLAETMLAAWLLDAAGLAVPEGPLTIGPVLAGERIDLTRRGTAWHVRGEITRIPWAARAAALVLLAEADGARRVVLLPAGAFHADAGRNLAGEPRDAVRFDAEAAATAPVALPAEAVLLMGAAMRTQQIAGALGAISEIAVQYAQDRSQFGRPIGRFQAVQQNLAVLAAQAAAVSAAAGMAAEAAAALRVLPIAAAKARAGEAAGIGAAIAHQALGAIGFTREHRLHLLTRRLWSWRDEFGAEAAWNARLGATLTAAGADGVWAALTAA